MLNLTQALALLATALPGLASSERPHEANEKPCTSSGCGITHHSGYLANFTVSSGNLTRYYSVNVPDNYNPDQHYPLIFDYHGNGDTSLEQWNNSQYYAYPGGDQYLAVYPQGYGGSWQGPTYATPGVDDLQFTTDLLAHIRSKYCVDSDRVYASGKSNGGGFVDTLACSDNGDEFAAFAMASAALYTDTSFGDCTKKRVILESHGDNDTTIPYAPTKNGKGGPLPQIKQWVSWWGGRDCGNDTKPVLSGDLGGYNTTSYSCHGWTDVVQHYQVFKLGHCWPSSSGNNTDSTGALKKVCKDHVLGYTPIVLDLFSRWSLKNAPEN